MKKQKIRRKENKNTAKNLKKNIKGITLIALVVTIIVLLILTSVAISLTIGNNGIITRAGNATDKWQEASKNEENEMNKASNFIDNLFNEGTKGMTLTDMYKKAEEDGCINEDGNCNNPDHLHIGDYVNYQNPSSGTYTVKAEKSGVEAGIISGIKESVDQTFDVSKNQLNWRVLGIDEETGGLKLIAGSPMKKNITSNIQNFSDSMDVQALPYLFLAGAKGYLNGVEELNNVGALYKNEYAVEARSIKMEDINAVLGIKSKEDIKKYNMTYDEPYSFENQYTPESWLNGKKQTTVSGNVSGYGFAIGKESESTEGKLIDMKNDRAKNMLFANTNLFDSNAQEAPKIYWIANRYTIAYFESSETRGMLRNLVIYSLNSVISMDDNFSFAGSINISPLFESERGSESAFFSAVRPVVILNKNITKDQIQIIPDKTEVKWN